MDIWSFFYQKCDVWYRDFYRFRKKYCLVFLEGQTHEKCIFWLKFNRSKINNFCALYSWEKGRKLILQNPSKSLCQTSLFCQKIVKFDDFKLIVFFFGKKICSNERSYRGEPSWKLPLSVLSRRKKEKQMPPRFALQLSVSS